MPPRPRSAGDDRTPGEIGRGLDALNETVRSLEQLVRSEMSALRVEMGTGFVRTDTFRASEEQAMLRETILEQRIASLEGDQKEAKADAQRKEDRIDRLRALA